MESCDVLCIQEHFLSSESLDILSLDGWLKVFGVSAITSQSGKGRPSGGIAVLARAELLPALHSSSDNYVAVKINETVIYSVYMPTDYRDLKSERKFSIACKKLASSVSGSKQQGLNVILAGDMNCNLSGTNPRSQIFLNALTGLEVLLNDLDFTYIHNSGATSALDFFLQTKQTTLPLPSPYVNTTINISDHLPVSCSFDTTIQPSIGLSKVRKWRKKSDWKKINIDVYQSVCDEIMGRIKVPYHLLQANPSLETTEKQIDLNVYCMEIIHALRVAESAAVPQRKVRIGTEVPRWKENPLLAQLCHASKFWHKMWMDIGKPRSGAVNTVRIYLKRKFAKCLQKHNATILDENSNTLKSDPNAVWNFLKRKKRSDCDGPSLWPTEEQWNSYYKIEFAAPDAQLVSKYEDNLDLLLSEASPSLGFVVTVSDVRAAIIKAKKKFLARH